MKEDFSNNLVKTYKYWEVYVHQNQGYLGRCVIWCKRENSLDLTDATLSEQKELFIILKDLKETTTKVFKPNWFNYSFLGNETRHLHGHFIPRYLKPKTFMGVIFEDKLYGQNYKTDHKFKTSRELLDGVRDSLKSAL